MGQAVLETNLSLPNKRSGKVRDLYDVTLADGTEALLIIASDRISAFDVVMQNGLPGCGADPDLEVLVRPFFGRTEPPDLHRRGGRARADKRGTGRPARPDHALPENPGGTDRVHRPRLHHR